MGGKTFVGPGVGFGFGVGCGFGVGWGFGGGPIGFGGMGAGGGCGVGVGLGWGFGAAFGSNYIIVDPEFGGEASPAAPPKPRWLSQLQQQLRIAKFEHSHKDSAR